MPSWLRLTDVPLFISRRRIAHYKTLPRALGRWAIDSGGFTELSMYGRWTISAAAYAAELSRLVGECGKVDWAAPQDWMCEPEVLRKTGLTVVKHQENTIDNFVDLRSRNIGAHVIPVIQGWEPREYAQHVAAYASRGINLFSEPLVGIGTVCRRQHTQDICSLIANELSGLRLHGFGFKLTGLKQVGRFLASADSMAWSYQARRAARLEGCTGHMRCNNCLRYAMRWRDRALSCIQ